MFKKPVASLVSAAFLMAGPGQLTLTAAAQSFARGAAARVNVLPAFGAGLNGPVLTAPSINKPGLAPGALISPSPLAAPRAIAAAPAALATAAKAAAAAQVKGSPLAVIASQDASISAGEKAAALNEVFENSARSGAETTERYREEVPPPHAVGKRPTEVLGKSGASIKNGLRRFWLPTKSYSDLHQPARGDGNASLRKISAFTKAQADAPIPATSVLFTRPALNGDPYHYDREIARAVGMERFYSYMTLDDRYVEIRTQSREEAVKTAKALSSVERVTGIFVSPDVLAIIARPARNAGAMLGRAANQRGSVAGDAITLAMLITIGGAVAGAFFLHTMPWIALGVGIGGVAFLAGLTALDYHYGGFPEWILPIIGILGFGAAGAGIGGFLAFVISKLIHLFA